MNIVNITNKVALGSVVVLIYWVFIFICTMVFDFKVFKENITEIFLFSILGILSVLFAAIALNIMFNLTTIAKKYQENKLESEPRKISRIIIGFGISLVVIFLLLYSGNLLTVMKKERVFVNSAKILLREQAEEIKKLADYKFSKEYINQASDSIKLINKIDEQFPAVTVIQQDSIADKKILLGFSQYSYNKKIYQYEPKKVNYILTTSQEEREYLYAVFSGEKSNYKFFSNKGRYEIYYPVKTEKGIVVLHLSQYSRYGKFGS